jgi:regulatory protein
LIEKLVRKGHAERIAKALIEELAADHWIDDAAYAAALAEEIVRRKPASAAFVKKKLRARKLDAADIDRAVAHSLEHDHQLSAALDLARKRHAAMRNADPIVARRRIGGTLARRGFDEDTINAVLHRLRLQE